MLRFVVLCTVLVGVLSQNADLDSVQPVTVTGDQFKDGVEKHDQTKKAVKNCTDPVEEKIQYVLHTREKPEGEIIYKNYANISDSSMNIKKKLKVLIHSWLQDKHWVKPVIEDYLYTQNVDVLVVDWSEYSLKCSMQSTTEYVTPMVGEALGNLLRHIIGLGHKGKRMHLIGFSHGAHIAGKAGRTMAPHLPARISALDPLRLEEIDQPGGIKLTGGDARFMDVIITSLPGLSFEYEIGDVTFYPNGGFTKYQGRCDDKTSPMEKMICSHALSYKLFAESLASPFKFRAVRCDSYTKYLAGKCNNSAAAHMGEYVEKNASGRYYLEINQDAPYDKGHNLPKSSEA